MVLDSLSNAGSRFGYPFTREPLRFTVGAALALYDPTLRPELLIRRARKQALRDADLNARIAERAYGYSQRQLHKDAATDWNRAEVEVLREALTERNGDSTRGL